jgi:hypothetical protein
MKGELKDVKIETGICRDLIDKVQEELNIRVEMSKSESGVQMAGSVMKN